MKHQTLRIIAYCLSILAWVVAVVGVAISIIMSIGATTFIAKIFFLLGGFVGTAIYMLVLLTASKLIYLFIDIEKDLSEVIGLLGKGKQ